MVSPSRSNGSIDDFFLATRCSQRQQHLSQNTRVSGIAEIEVSGQPRPRRRRTIQRVKLVKHRQMSAPTAQGHFQPGGNAPGIGAKTAMQH